MTPGSRAVPGLLALAVVVAAAVLARMLMTGADDTPGRASGNSPAGGDAVVTSVEAKSAALTAAERATARVLSYSYSSLADDVKASRSLLAGEMLEQYDDTMDSLGPEAARTRREVDATVVGSSVISVTAREAEVLLFVNTESRERGLEGPSVERTRVVVTLHREHGTVSDADAWRVTALDSV